jgi:hypothetical protein
MNSNKLPLKNDKINSFRQRKQKNLILFIINKIQQPKRKKYAYYVYNQ